MIESPVRIHGTPCRELSEGARQRVVDSELPFGSCAPNEFFQKRNGLPPSSGDTLIDVRKARRREVRVKQSGNTAISVVSVSIKDAGTFIFCIRKSRRDARGIAAAKEAAGGRGDTPADAA